MLIKIDLSLSDLHVSSAVGRRALSELLRSHRQGIHLVVMDRGLAEEIISSFTLSDEELSTINQIRAEFTQTADLIRRCRTYLSIVGEDMPPTAIDSICVKVGLRSIVNSRILDRPTLVLENISSDGALFDFIFNNLYTIARCPIPAWDRDHGGGDDIADVIVHRVQERRIVCTIVDSDLLTPFEKDNGKLDRIRAKIADFAWPLVYISSLPCHEVENIIPLRVFREVDHLTKADTQHLLLIDESEEKASCAHADRFWMYFDIKNGFTSDMVTRVSSEISRQWLMSKILPIIKNESDPVVITGHGNRVVSRLLKNNSACDQFSKAIRSSEWQSIFMDLFENYLWVFAAARRKIT